jgi:hypothetical protein
MKMPLYSMSGVKLGEIEVNMNPDGTFFVEQPTQLPSAADLDVVAEEDKIRERTSHAS